MTWALAVVAFLAADGGVDGGAPKKVAPAPLSAEDAELLENLELLEALDSAAELEVLEAL